MGESHKRRQPAVALQLPEHVRDFIGTSGLTLAQGEAQANRRITSVGSWVAGGSLTRESRGSSEDIEDLTKVDCIHSNLNDQTDGGNRETSGGNRGKPVRDMHTSRMESGEPSKSPLKSCAAKLQNTGNMMNELLDLTRKGMGIMGDGIPAHCLNVLKAKPANQTLCPATSADRRGKWETLSAIVDSGASITAVNPATGKHYEVQESEASKKGDEVEIANGDTMPLLGKKLMAVMTKEGTLRGFESHVADVSGPLESVRQLLGSKHCVLFGLGPNEEHHLIINKISGEVNMMRDDGVNYLHDMLIVPPDEVDEVHQALQSSQPFGRQA